MSGSTKIQQSLPDSKPQHPIGAGGDRTAGYQRSCLEPKPRAPFQSFKKLPGFCSCSLELAKPQRPPLPRQRETEKEFGKLFCPREESASNDSLVLTSSTMQGGIISFPAQSFIPRVPTPQGLHDLFEMKRKIKSLLSSLTHQAIASRPWAKGEAAICLLR